MNILHVTDNIWQSSGVSVWCVELCESLIDMGHVVKLALQHPDCNKSYPIRYNEMLTTIKEAMDEFDVGKWDLIHINGVWNWPYHKIAQLAYKYGVPVVWSPHGSLSRWALHYKWWKKLPAWWLYQKYDMMRATLIHVTAENEMNDVRRLGLDNKVVLVPLGVHMPICGGITATDGGAIASGHNKKAEGSSIAIESTCTGS